jgi:hypothetical protein
MVKRDDNSVTPRHILGALRNYVDLDKCVER